MSSTATVESLQERIDNHFCSMPNDKLLYNDISPLLQFIINNGTARFVDVSDKLVKVSLEDGPTDYINKQKYGQIRIEQGGVRGLAEGLASMMDAADRKLSEIVSDYCAALASDYKSEFGFLGILDSIYDCMGSSSQSAVKSLAVCGVHSWSHIRYLNKGVCVAQGIDIQETTLRHRFAAAFDRRVAKSVGLDNVIWIIQPNAIQVIPCNKYRPNEIISSMGEDCMGIISPATGFVYDVKIRGNTVTLTGSPTIYKPSEAFFKGRKKPIFNQINIDMPS